MDPLRVVVLVSEDISDIYFANQMLKHLNVVGVVIEQQADTGRSCFTARCLKGLVYAATPWKLYQRVSSSKVYRAYHKMARRVGRDYFGIEAESLVAVPRGCKIIHADGNGAINAPVYIGEIKSLKPDLLVVCGCSILKEGVLSIPPMGALNLHGGLAQRYRGIWTTMWAVYNSEPEYVGATVHYISPGIDDGDIVYQGRPDISADDNSESLYAKVVILGVQMMVDAVQKIQTGAATRHPLPEKGLLYLGRMVTADVLKQAMMNIDNGLLSDYLHNKQRRDEKVVASLHGSYSGNR